MIKLDVPFYYALQNFVFLPDGTIEWTTASQTPIDKIKRLINEKKWPKMSHTRTSGDIPGHAQLVQLHNGKLVVGDEGLMKWGESYTLEGAPDYCDPIQQGLDQDLRFIYTVFGNSGKGDILLFKHDYAKKLISKKVIPYSLYGKWYHKGWESEGLRVKPGTGEVWFGIDFKTIFGTHEAYIEEVFF